MVPRQLPPKSLLKLPDFDVQAYLDSAGATRRIVHYRRGQRVFGQGGPADAVMYLQQGTVKLSVLSRVGKEAVVAMFSAGGFFGGGGARRGPGRLPTAA